MDNAATPDHRLRDILVSGFDAGAAIPYTGRNRERPLTDVALAFATAIRAANDGDATDYYRMKESGVDVNHDDPHAPRRAQLDAQFHELPPAGSADYWRRIEESDVGQELPPEVLTRCLRERLAAGFVVDAHRIFGAIMRQIEVGVGKWAWSIARQAKSGMAPERHEELEQECYMKLWEELQGDGPTFLLENFDHKLDLICKHVQHSVMEKAGEWRRRGVEKPTRVPSGEIERIDVEPEGDGELPLAAQLASASAQQDINLAEYSDLLSQVEQLPPDERAIIQGLFYDGRTQEEIAADLGVTSRTIRNRLKKILRELLDGYQGGEEDNHV
jgi:RNA polymerase sigma factor (sigma-70 family)